jgi:hypothetical protein
MEVSNAVVSDMASSAKLLSAIKDSRPSNKTFLLTVDSLKYHTI